MDSEALNQSPSKPEVLREGHLKRFEVYLQRDTVWLTASARVPSLLTSEGLVADHFRPLDAGTWISSHLFVLQ